MTPEMGGDPGPRVRQSLKDTMGFRKDWRGYQSRLLERLDSSLDDKRFHLIAAPGSGKTVIGLEVIRRIDQPTLVLAPTITIRDQWVERLVDLFLPSGKGYPSWLSTQIGNPALLTVATYQALHAMCSGEPETPAADSDEEGASGSPLESRANGEEPHRVHPGHRPIPAVLIEAEFNTLVLDEAHHLRTEWWKTLTSFAGQLRQPTIVALTATPPYDVSFVEWRHYEELCGPVDAEVSVPELVQARDLCPHQDYVFFSAPTTREQGILSDFRAAVDEFVARLESNAAFIDAVRSHPWVSASGQHTEDILDDPEYLSSMVVFLQAVGQDIPRAVLHILGVSRRRIPALTLEWLEVLLSRCLDRDEPASTTNEAIFKAIRRDLLNMGALERRKVRLRNPSDHLKLLTTSITKLGSIERIVTLEADALGEQLRCVVLTDFIRKAELPKPGDPAPAFEEIGVVPVFEFLRAASVRGIRLGVLSGSLVIVPTDAVSLLGQAASASGIEPRDLSISPLAHDPSFSTVEIRGGDHRGTVRLITSVFEQGGMTVLVGTKSLLGEGWDAPCINTLVLASFVGSFVLSNQMRGRAIRVDPSRPRKTANIWHLVCAEPGPSGPGADYELLVRRCSAFVGVSAIAPAIENGTERLGIGHPPFSREELDAVNTRTRARALDRDGLRRQWQDALDAGSIQQLVHGLRAPEKSLPRGFVLVNTIASLSIQSLYVFLNVVQWLGRVLGRVWTTPDAWSLLLRVLGIAAAVSLPWSVIAVWRLIRHGTPENSMGQIGRAVLDALAFDGSLDGRAGDCQVSANGNQDGTVFCWMGGGSGKDQAVFLQALKETLGPIENPRYLLARRRVWRFFREDYFAVPEVLARRKECAEYFAQRWRTLVGPVQLVFTRTPEGRRLLLRARNHSLSGAFQKRAERLSCWK